MLDTRMLDLSMQAMNDGIKLAQSTSNTEIKLLNNRIEFLEGLIDDRDREIKELKDEVEAYKNETMGVSYGNA